MPAIWLAREGAEKKREKRIRAAGFAVVRGMG